MSILSMTAKSDHRATGSSAEPMDPARFTYEHARHLLLRAGFGGSPQQVAALWSLGLDTAVDVTVDYWRTVDPAPPHGVTPTVGPTPAQLARMSDQQRRMQNMARERQDRKKFQQLRSWWLGRMLRSRRPLEEKMTLFWHGHFACGYREVRNTHQMAVQNELFRKHATGNVGRLVYMICRDPAMLRYLDNNQNKRGSPNENFARELLELFTLGVGNYTEADVKEAARAFTGWTFGAGRSMFRFVRRNHDHGQKKFLGHVGTLNGDDIVRIILDQEAAPRHVAGRLLAFLAAEPTADEREPYAQLLRRNRYEIKPLLSTLFKSEWFYSDAVMGRQVKSPVMFVASTLRAMGVEQIDGDLLVRSSAGVGQDIMQPPNVGGWSGGAAWITTSNLIGRYNIARDLISAQRARQAFSPFDVVQRAGVSAAAEIMALFEKRFLATGLAPERRQALLDFLGGADDTPPLDLSTPQIADRKLREFLQLLATAPEFQLC